MIYQLCVYVHFRGMPWSGGGGGGGRGKLVRYISDGKVQIPFLSLKLVIRDFLGV